MFALTRSQRFGIAMAGPLLIYLMIVFVVGWLGYSIAALGQDANALGAPLGGLRTLVEFGWAPVALLAIGLLPAMVLTCEVARRQEKSRLALFALGAASWAGWGGLIFGTAGLARTVVLDVAPVVGTLFVLAVAGGLFAELALRRAAVRPGALLVSAALAVAVVVLAGEVLTAGLWGSAV
jgi:hypothetical protein